ASLDYVFFFQAEDGIRDFHVTGVQTCALPIWPLQPPPLAPGPFVPAPLLPGPGTPAPPSGMAGLVPPGTDRPVALRPAWTRTTPDRKSVVQGKSVDARGPRLHDVNRR